MSESIVLERHINRDAAHNAGASSRRRIYILPTRNGFFFAAMLCVLFLGAVNYNNSLAYILTFLLSSVSLVGMFHTYKNMAGLIIRPGQPEPVFAGEIAQFPVFFDNRNMTARYSLQLVCKQKPRRWYKPGISEGASLLVDLEEDDFQTLLLKKKTQQRGLHKYGRLQISNCFPLGLFRAWSNIDIDKQCIVYPKAQGNQPIPRESGLSHDEDHGKQDGNDDFVGLRRYRQGDSSRQLDWKTYAKERGLHSKQFEGLGSSRLLFRWQQLEHLNSTEQILSQLCQWVLIAAQNKQVYGLDIPGCYIAADTGEQHQQQCLTALACYGLKTT